MTRTERVDRLWKENMTGFEGAAPALGQALSKRGYTVLTPVQEAVLDPDLGESDVLVSAQTGSGKTVAFGLALAKTLLQGADRFERATVPLALAVAPTRELALQVKRELEWLYAETGASVTSCVGGMDMRDERQALQRGAHIVVGTPGRLRDHIERHSLNMTGLRAVVLDEADEMLDLGFRDDLEFILDAAPAERRTLMFSATVPNSIRTLAKRYQRDAVRISTSSDREQHVDIEYRALTVAPNDRENAIINVLRYFEAKNALVFCSTRAAVNRMTSRFSNRGFSVVALSGELSQKERSHALQSLRDGRARVCIATDVASRGLDLPDLELVIHADLPKNRESLLHRSGRTGRAGRKGVCVVIVPHNARKWSERLLSSANVVATWAKPPSIDDITQRDRERIFEDPSLSEAPTEDEQVFAAELLARHSAEQIATAFLRLHTAGQSAPEELLDNAPPEPEERVRERKPRDDFKNGVWFSLSVGRKEKAEPRWLLPALIRAGKLAKGDIGAIKIRENETHVELAPGCVAGFLEAIGSSGLIEKTIFATPLDGATQVVSAPKFDRPRHAAVVPAEKPQQEKKPYSRDKERNYARSESKPKPKYEQRLAVPMSAPVVLPDSDAKPERPARDDGQPAKTGKKFKDKKFTKKKPVAKKRLKLRLVDKSAANQARKTSLAQAAGHPDKAAGFSPRKRIN
ncbi:MAG: ATP-dependent RNA helicase DeaD [Alphaproteobacteria bacterium]|jgi:ATP-dependent RNA helicase DeaD